jgi:hypothetical protein
MKFQSGWFYGNNIMILRENLSQPTIGHTLHIDFEVKPIKF